MTYKEVNNSYLIKGWIMADEINSNDIRVFDNVSFTYGGKAYLVGDTIVIKGVECEVASIDKSRLSFNQVNKPKKKKLASKQRQQAPLIKG